MLSNRYICTLISIFIILSASYSAESINDKHLLDIAKKYFSPLPKNFLSRDDPKNPYVIKLGKMLFFERKLSVNDMISCASCHPIEYYYSSPAKKQMGAIKIQDRNAPTVLNSGGNIAQHWIGNRKDLEEQALKSLTGPAAFGNDSTKDVEEKIEKNDLYKKLFKLAFPEQEKPVKAENIAKAIAVYEKVLVTPSRFDEFLKGNLKALSKQEKDGLKTFIQVGCASCHNGPLVGGSMFQKFGIYYPYWEFTKSQVIDYGRYSYTNDEADMYVYKVPSLRNIELTAPYFHDGSVDSLKDAIKIMAKIQLNRDLDQKEIDSIFMFLKSLTGKLPEISRTPPIIRW